MLRPTTLISALTAAAMLAGCQGAAGLSGAKPRTAATPGPGARPTTANTFVLAGAVNAPAGVVAAGGANVVAAGGGNVIAPGGANFRVSEAVAQAPLAGTQVQLTDAKGRPVSGVADVTTDAKGRYSFNKVPAAGGPYIVVAKARTESGKDAAFRTLVKPGAGANADVDAGSTLSTAFMLDQFAGDLSGFDNARFRKMAAILAANLEASAMPDWSDPADVLTTVKGLSESLSDLGALVDDLAALPGAKENTDAAKETLTEAEKKAQEAQQAIEDALKQAGGAPQP